jgi:SAM-dependent methyltransferase
MSTEVRQLDTAELEQRVKRMYEDVAREPEREFHFETGRALAERLGYPAADLDRIPAAAIDSFAGVGYFLDLAAIEAGERVLDLGSGSGTDSFLAAVAAGAAGGVVGIDMTEAQLVKARRLPRESGFGNVEFIAAYIEQPPVDDGSFDCVISNGVINLSPDKPAVFAAAARVAARRTPRAGRHRERAAAARGRDLRRVVVGGVHRRGDATRRLPRGDRGGRLRNRYLATEQRIPLRLRARRQSDAEVRRHERVTARSPRMSALAEPRGDRAVALILDGIAALARTGGAR